MYSTIRSRAIVVALVSLLALTGCTAGSTTEAVETATAEPKPTASATPTPEAPPVPKYSDIELEAVRVAGYGDPSSVDTLYGICAKTDHMYQTTGPMNDGQRAESRGALVLCPDHPAALVMGADAPIPTAEQQELIDGRRFSDGVREIGQRVQPGTFRTTAAVTNCYWARLDSSGRTIENDFVPAATQVEVTVQPRDFSLHTDGCGDFVRID